MQFYTDINSSHLVRNLQYLQQMCNILCPILLISCMPKYLKCFKLVVKIPGNTHSLK